MPDKQAKGIISMKIFKLLLLAAFSLILAGCVSAQTNKRKTIGQTKTKTAKPTNAKSQTKSVNAKTFYIGPIVVEAYSNVETPFIFVARSAETYAELQKFVSSKLPNVAEIDFNRSAVVAAFAGTKSSGGYSVSIKKTAGKVSVEVIEPPKDAITTSALTTPYAVAVVSIEAEKTLTVEAAGNWKTVMQNYKITSGEFESSGGFAGRLNKFSAEGTISVLSFGEYATFFFDLSAKGSDANKQLTETASGVIKNGKIELKRLDAGTFSEGPKPPMKVSGTILNDKLVLALEPLPSIGADGFQVSGKIEAVKVRK
jgi:hypothetical protein